MGKTFMRIIEIEPISNVIWAKRYASSGVQSFRTIGKVTFENGDFIIGVIITWDAGNGRVWYTACGNMLKCTADEFGLVPHDWKVGELFSFRYDYIESQEVNGIIGGKR